MSCRSHEGRPVASVRAFAWIASAALATSAVAKEPALEDLHALLAPMRVTNAGGALWPDAASSRDLRFARPELMKAKRLLRDWIEASLARQSQAFDARDLAARLNARLRRADLFCERGEGEAKADRCEHAHADWNAIGFVYPGVRFERPEPDVLVAIVGLGIECGMDASAYAYEWRGSRWVRLWQNEQNVAVGVEYEPQWIESVSVSRRAADGDDRLVLTVGYATWCQSNFHPIYARLWRTKSLASPVRLLLDLQEQAYLGADPPVAGRVSRDAVRIDFTRSAPDPTVHSYRAVLAYRVTGDQLTRVDPIALSPLGFVFEWLQSDWSQSAALSAPRAREDLARAHARWHRLTVPGSTEGTALFVCATHADFEVEIPASVDREDGVEWLYFRVREQGPKQFRMVALRGEPSADCTERSPRSLGSESADGAATESD